MNPNTYGLGKNQKHLLKFAVKYDGWHSYADNSATNQTVKSLVKRGLIVVNGYRQFTVNHRNRLACVMANSNNPKFYNNNQ